MKNRASAIILAAGKSQRMGKPKAFLPFDEMRCFAGKIAEEYYTFGIRDIIFVTNKDLLARFKRLEQQFTYLKTALNRRPETGRFSSFLCGIQAASDFSRFYFIHNTDMPVFEQSLLNKLWKNRMKGDYIVPRNAGRGGHPILINKTIGESAKNQQSRNINFREFLSQFKKAYTEVQSESIRLNINTPDDYADFLKKRTDFNTQAVDDSE